MERVFLRWAIAIALMIFWNYFLNTREKIAAILTTGMFNFEEYLFTGFVDGAMSVKAPHRNSSAALKAMLTTGYSSIAMFLINLFYYPLGIKW